MNVTIEVYDTISKKIVEIEVDEEFAKEYKRMIWREENSDRAFRRHQTVTSELKGGEDDSFENFHEFIVGDEYDGSDNVAIRKAYIRRLKEIIKDLPDYDKQIIDLLFYKGMSVTEVARMTGTSHQNVSEKRIRVLAKIHKLFENQ